MGGVPYTFPAQPSSVRCPHPNAILQPLVHQRGCSWEGHPGFDCQGCCGACSSSLPRLLQPSVFGLENLGVVETSHRSLDSQPLCGRVTFPNGDHPVCPPVCTSGRLDGLHRSQGGLPSGSSPSGISTLPSLCDKWPGLPVHSSVFWPLHGSAGFLLGHGSCFLHPPFLGYPHEAVPRRLASPVVLTRVSPPGPSCGADPLSGSGHRHQPGEVQPSAFSGGSVSRGGDRCPVFCGFSFARSRRQATANSWRISVLRRSSSQYLALAARHAVLAVPSRSRGLAPHEVAPALSPPFLGSEVVAALALPLSGGISQSSVSRPGLLVRRLGRRLGAHLGLLTASGLWSHEESQLSINAKELLAVRRGLLHFQSSLLGMTVSVFCDNSTAVAYLRKEGALSLLF